MIIESVQHDLHRVVIQNVFTPAHARSDFLWLIVETDEDNVEVLVVVSEVGDRALRNRRTVDGFTLNESVYNREFPLPCGSWRHLEKIFERRGTLHDRHI